MSKYSNGENNNMINEEMVDKIKTNIHNYFNELLYSWNNALFTGKVISEESLKKMIGKYADSGEEGYYGYGIFTSDVKLGEKMRKKIYHGGGIPGFFASNSIFPTEDVQIIMITNVVSEAFAHKISKVEEIIFKDI
ncbi:serine hydrolase [Clostridium lundense]|uniref:serine hydrolase n=1 Tax=Clostridium lundense TaxID=319475 RepID=UPI000489B24D|nr:serine hydrolase [Clostridium lundense]